MSDYWQKKLDELNERTESNASSSNTSNYWQDKTTTIGKKQYDQHTAETWTRVKARLKQKEEEKKKKEEQEKKWYEKGYFEDGYDFGDVTKTILGVDDKKELKTFTAPDTTDSLDVLNQKVDYFKGRKWLTPEQTKESLKVTQQRNEMALYQYSETLSQTKMDGTDHTVLEEIEILANMKSGKEKDERKKKVLEKMEELGMDSSFYSHFAGDGEFDWNTFCSWLSNSAMAGLNTFNKALLDTADVLLGAPLKELGWENNPISEGAEYYSDLYDAYRYNANLMAERLGGSAWNFGTDAVEGTVGALPQALLMFMTGGQSATATTSSLTTNAAMQTGNVLTKAGLTVETMLKNPQYWMSFSRELGSDYKEAKELGASDTAAAVGSVLKSFVNSGIEIGLDGGSGIQGLPGGLKEGGKPFWEWVESSIEEGGEEILQKFVGEVVNKFGYGSDEEMLNPIEYAKEGAIGVISGAALGGGQTAVASGANAYAEHQANKLTDVESAVKDKIVQNRIAEKEKDGKTLTAKEKAAIEEEVDRNLRKGYLSAEEIEEAIGGESYENFKREKDNFFGSDTYKNFKNDSKRIEKIEKQLEEMGNQPNTVANAKKYENTQTRLDILKQRNAKAQETLTAEANRIMGIRNQMRSQVMEGVKGSRLAESYNELARKQQKFEVDVSQYTNENAKKTVQSILDSGLGDNSRQFHETVDWLAKLSEERNVTFDLTKTERLKGTKHYREGYVTNGFKTKNGDLTNITINLDGNYLNTTVGHEITHVLEEVGVYADLANAVKSYAIAKEGQDGYQKRLDGIKEIYGDDQATIDSELTADIIGEYLFTDYEFVHRLSTDNRNVFQKIYDEIKYLYKIATADSKEARELEKLKKTFDKVWRENVKGKAEAQTETKTESKATIDPENDSDLDYESPNKYSISVKDPDTIDFLENQEHITTYKAMVLIDGKLYPPMASKVKGEDGKYHMTNARELGEWMQAEEDTTNIKFNDKGIGYYDLKKDDGGTVRAAYNPYEHSSNLVLNDQFEAAYKRDNLVTVECVIPKSEIDTPYTAEYAKDSTGMMDWHSGIVAGKLKDNKRSVYLSRYLKVTRVVPDSEVAQKYKDIVGDLAVPFNVVSPSLLTELENVGVNIDYDGSPGYQYHQRKAAEKEAKKQAEQSVKVLKGGSVTKYSLSTWTPESQAKTIENLVKAGFAKEDVNKWISDTNGVASVIASDKARLDFEAADNQVMLKDNQEYIKTLDASTLCAKRLVYQGTFDAIQHRLPNTVLSSDDLIDLLNMMKEDGVQTPCGVCYVESRRRHLGTFAQKWLDSYEGEYKPRLDEVTTSDGLEKLRHSHPQAYKDFVDAMSRKGSSNPKVVQLRTEYRNDILNLTPAQIRKIEAIGGLRVQSFSDFETPHLLDMMQAVMDMSAKGLHSQAYTKVPNFAWVFGDTGIKINLSLIAEGNGFDSDGNLAFSSVEGMDIDEAMRLRDAYSKNVGTIIVGANDKHILACMADERIDYIIPFHRSGWGMNELKMMGMSSYTDYTYGQKEHDLNKPTKVINGVLQYAGLENLYPPDYWNYELSGKENAERYLNLCAKLGREPKFSQFLVNNGDGTYSLQPDGSTDGYWKMLIDFKMYDNDGNGAAQQTVVPNFNMEEAHRVLNEYEGGANKLPVAQDIVEKFVAKYSEDISPVKYSISKADTDYMDAVNRGDMETMQKMVGEAAKEAGFDSDLLYHGTTGFGFTKIDVGMSDDGISFFATDSLETARTYSGQDGVRTIKESQDEVDVEELENAYDDKVLDFISLVNRTSGQYNFLDYNDTEFKWFKTQLVEGTATYDDVQELLGDRIEEIVMALYDNELYYNEDLDQDEFYESSKIEAIYEASGDLYHILKGIAEWGESGTGNYQLYANTEGLFEIDAKGNRWNQIPFESSSGLYSVNTRRLAAYAKQEGYKGVKISNVFDDGGRSIHYQKEPATVYIFFNPENQVKSADAVTYDESGNVIPLSERFKADNNDIRYSMTKQQSYHDYLDAVNSGDTDTAQKLMDDFAKDAGYNYRGVHRSFSEFTVFDREKIGSNAGTRLGDGFYVTLEFKDEATAKYADESYGKNRMDLYVKMDSPLILGIPFDESIVNQMEEDFSEFGWFGEDSTAHYAVTPEKIKKIFQSNDGYEQMETIRLIANRNGMAISELLKQYGFDSVIDENDYVKQAVVFDETQLKSADPVTYDEYGDVIMPYERFDQDNMDIRYSISKGKPTSGDWHIDGSDFGYTEEFDFAPVGDNVETTTEAPIDATVAKNATTEAPIQDAPVQDVTGAETEVKQTRKEYHQGIVDNVKAIFKSRGLDLDEVLRKARNLSTWSTVDNTPQRVMEKALGYKEGGILADITVNKVAQNEAEGIKWINKNVETLKQISKQYRIKPGSKQSAAAQMYAEGFYVDKNNNIVQYGDRELAIDFPDAKVRENIKGLARDPRIRKIYDDTLASINESRTRNLYPEIPRLNNYFLHFRAMNDTFSTLGLPFNPNDIRAKDLPTDLNGVTADLKPGQPYFASAMHREGKRTSFDMLGGIERYLNSAKNQIYHIDDIQTLRALRNYIADTYGQAKGLEDLDSLTDSESKERLEQVYGSHLSTFAKFLHEEANVLAGKTALIDRGAEGIFGRRAMTFMKTLNSQVGSNQVGYNISSSLTNFMPVAQTFANTNKFDFVKAFAQTVANKLSGGRLDSFAEDSPVVIRRQGTDRFYQTPWQKLQNPGYVLMSAVDDISTELIARTKYNEFTRKGMDSQKAHFETDKWVSRLMGDRSLGQQPQLFNSQALGLFTKYQLEVRNYLDSAFYDTIKEVQASNEDIQNNLARNAKTAAQITSRMVSTAVVMHLFGKAFESVAGYNPAFDIVEALMTAFGYDDDDESEDTVADNLTQALMVMAEDMPYASLFLDGGRIPISDAIPNIPAVLSGEDEYGNDIGFVKALVEETKDVAPYYVMPAGYGQFKKTVAGLKMFSDEHPIAGSYTASGNLRFPVEDTLGNRVQAALFGQYSSENARKYFDEERSTLYPDQIEIFKNLDMPIEEYWEYRDNFNAFKETKENLQSVANSNLATDEDILKSKYATAIYGDLYDLYDEQKAIANGDSVPLSKKIQVKAIQEQMTEMLSKAQSDMDNIYINGYYATIGDKRFDYNDYNHKWYEISGEYLENEQKAIERYGITPDEYWNNQDTYYNADYYFKYDPQREDVSKIVFDGKWFANYASEVSQIKGEDLNNDGKTDTNSKKKNIFAYIDELDVSDIERKILRKMSYPSEKTYNREIAEYIVNLDASYAEKKKALESLNYKVDAEGYISW